MLRSCARGIFFIEDRISKKQESLKTRDKIAAQRIFNARNEAYQQPAINLQIARAYLVASDPAIATRTWQHVMDDIVKTKLGETKARWLMAIKDGSLDTIRNLPVLSTIADDFLRAIDAGTVSTNVYLRRVHNFALDMNWLPSAVIRKKRWPKVSFKEKRAITHEEHQKIIRRERNPEWRAFYELCWHIGGSQTDIATLHGKDIDWVDETVTFTRRKTSVPVIIRFGSELAEVLKSLPESGPLFPRLSQLHEKHRAKLFRRRCDSVGITGVSLHSYRYAWAERAKVAGYPERFAQQALGHNSAAVHRAYAKKAQVTLPPLEEYEKKFVPFNRTLAKDEREQAAKQANNAETELAAIAK